METFKLNKKNKRALNTDAKIMHWNRQMFVAAEMLISGYRKLDWFAKYFRYFGDFSLFVEIVNSFILYLKENPSLRLRQMWENININKDL